MSLNFDISKIPFTCFGSYLAISSLGDGDTQNSLYLRSVRGPALGGRPLQKILQVEIVQNDEPISFQTEVTPWLLTIKTDYGIAEIGFASPSSIRLRTRNLVLRLRMVAAGEYDFAFPLNEKQWQIIISTACETKLLCSLIKGKIFIDAPWNEEHCQSVLLKLQPEIDSGIAELQIDEFVIEPEIQPSQYLPFEDCIKRTKIEFDKWASALPVTESQPQLVRDLACYVLWSCFVKPSGLLSRNTLYASKNGMIGLWSWDHCFFTRAFYKIFPELAWDQLLIPFDFQKDSGVIPDFVNDRYVSWNFCKPPVHGWLLITLFQDRNLLDLPRLKEIYEPLSMWTHWWLERRNYIHDGLPFYNHGNDSGWDNSTVFLTPPPIQSPDLASFLVLQTEFLAFAARELGLFEKSSKWKEISRLLLTRLIDHFWRKDHFIAYDLWQNPIESQSLQLLLPLVLGQRLPPNIIKRLSQLLNNGGYVTNFGLASESTNSPHYRADGYWRGPIWPAPNLLLYEALDTCGFKKEAQDIRGKFLKLVNLSGFAENYNALTGEGYNDFHFSWTASIYFAFLQNNDFSTRGSLRSKERV